MDLITYCDDAIGADNFQILKGDVNAFNVALDYNRDNLSYQSLVRKLLKIDI